MEENKPYKPFKIIHKSKNKSHQPQPQNQPASPPAALQEANI